jgi:tetratricopeptide (TPR) repeat protein
VTICGCFCRFAGVAPRFAFMLSEGMFGNLFGKKPAKNGAQPSDDAAPEAPAPAGNPQAPQAFAAPLGAPMAPIEPPPTAPAPAADAVAAIAQQAQAGAVDLANQSAQIERAIRAAGGDRGAPITPDAVNTLRTAAEALVASPDAAARAAAQALIAGRLDEGFEALRRDADEATGAARVERLRRLGGLAFLARAGVALDAYQTAFEIDPRDFWQCIYLGRLRGLAGRLDLSLQAAEAALAEARAPAERSQAEAELALIALGRSAPDDARRHGRACVEALRPADAPLDLAQRLSLLGDVSVMLGDMTDADQAYGEALSILRRLGAQHPSDLNLARLAADAQEKLAAVIGRQKRFGEAVAASTQAVDLRRKLLQAQPGEAAEMVAYATACNTLGELQRLAGDEAGARDAFSAARDAAAAAIGAKAGLAGAHREHWVALWRLAQLTTPAAAWADVLASMDKAKAVGALSERDEAFYKEAQRRLRAT